MISFLSSYYLSGKLLFILQNPSMRPPIHASIYSSTLLFIHKGVSGLPGSEVGFEDTGVIKRLIVLTFTELHLGLRGQIWTDQL